MFCSFFLLDLLIVEKTSSASLVKNTKSSVNTVVIPPVSFFFFSISYFSVEYLVSISSITVGDERS